jgi:hypothetical protein
VIFHEYIEKELDMTGWWAFTTFTDGRTAAGETAKVFIWDEEGLVVDKRGTPEERYKENIRRQQTLLEEFAAHEIEWADDLLRLFVLGQGSCLYGIRPDQSHPYAPSKVRGSILTQEKPIIPNKFI